MFAVIKTGGKQYIVAPGQIVKIEKLDVEAGASVVFDDVLLVVDGEKITVGMPTIQGAAVSAKVARQFRTRKVTVFKYHPKTRYHKKAGHRQQMTEVEIKDIKVK